MRDESRMYIEPRIASLDADPMQDVMELRGFIGEEIRYMEGQLKEIKYHRDRCDEKLMEVLTKDGLKNASTEKYQAILSVETLPNVEDWDKVYNYIIETRNCNLLHKRISSNVYKELCSIGSVPPGITTYEKSKINFRKR